VPPEISLCLFRVMQEALRNALKHSGAQHIEVGLWGTPHEVHLSVSERGIGFDSEAAKRGRGLVRIPVMWATDYGDVGQSRSEATLVVSYISYVAHMSQEKGK
jgi:glucose-6-phosphate-specific signal transduction histidine kinase